MKNYILLIVVCCGLAFAKAQNITAAEYFIDTDPGVGQGTALTINNAGADITDSFTVNIGAQSIGFHRMYVRVQDANSVWSLYHNFLFYVADAAPLNNPALPNITAMEYFIDSDPGIGMGTQVAINNIGTDIVDSFTANIGALPIGFHRLYTRVQDANGVWSLYDKFLFYVSDPTPINNPPLPAIVAAEYFLGADPGFGNATAVTLAATGNQDQFMFDIDFSSFTSCSTTPFHLRVQDANGVWSLYDFDPALLIDTEGPVADISILNDVSGQCEVTTLSAPTATDSCTTMQVTGTSDAVFPITTTSVVTWTYDDGNGNASTQTQNVIINDTTAPVPTVATLADVNEQCEVISLIPPTATDNCNGAVTVSNNASLPITSDSTITWTYDDGNGNTSTQTQNVIINDTTAPVPTAATLADVNVQCEVISLTPPTATDNCNGIVTVSSDASLPITTTTIVNWTYDDGNGNTSTQAQNIVIADTVDPVAIGQNITIDLAGNNSISIVGADIDNGSNDNCSAVTLTAMPDTFTAVGTYTVSLTATDATGNAGATTVQVTVDDTLSSEEFEFEKSIKIYPNPTDTFLFIKTEHSLRQIELFDLAGKTLSIQKNKLDKISLQDFSQGVYLLKLTTIEGNSVMKRIIKN